ncbi:MAG TPA: DUF4157 domain-containing protein [Anaerolineales bacterium]|nr:DUF4157 domain-containing protein [Anaerolineales bacterium]
MSNLLPLITEKKPMVGMAHPYARHKSACAICAGDEHRHLQRKTAEGGNEPARIPALVQDVLTTPGKPLDAAVRNYFEPRFGQDFSRVRVHTDERAGQSAPQVRALAYTVGNDMVFGRGQFAPETDPGRKLMAHELAHVVQQASTSAGLQTAGLNGSAYDRLEREADVAADRVLAGRSPEGLGNHAWLGLQRQTAPGGNNQDVDACAKLENDRESFSIMAARHFLAQVDPGSNPAARSVECHDNPVDPERLECIVTFVDGNKITVTWLKDLNNVEAQRQTSHGREWCVYHYECDSTGAINYIKKGCSSDYGPAPNAGKNMVG